MNFSEIEDERVRTALLSKNSAVNDFFGGWKECDLDLLQRYRNTIAVEPQLGEIVDWLGIRTDAALHAWRPMPASAGVSIQSLPIPDDQVHAEAIEYIALIVALERAVHSGGIKFAMMELGASYAPWATAAAVLAKRAGFGDINLVAVEASGRAVPTISEHAARNGLLAAKGVNFKAIHGAIFLNDEDIFFPKVDVAGDNGAQIAVAPSDEDYRGLRLEYDTVKGFSLATLCADYERIDFLHMDVQGAEADLLNNDSFLSTLNTRVATFFLATQSRFIEGLALQKMAALGWILIRERPTTYSQNARTKDINGWTLRDGGQLWLNRRFGDEHIAV